MKEERTSGAEGFTLIEMLVATGILTLILVIMLSVTNHVSGLWRSSNSRIEAFQSARLGFETLTNLLSQATLNSYYDYDDPNAPKRFIRKSELHFLTENAASALGNGHYGHAVFFQAPAVYDGGGISTGETGALASLLNSVGFFVEFSSDREKGWVPSFVSTPAAERFRLMQWLQPTSQLSIYQTESGGTARNWLQNVSAEAIPVADNVIALIVWPKEPDNQSSKRLEDSYRYDSRDGAENSTQPANANQLPPLLQITMVAIDEDVANRLGSSLKSTITAVLDGLFIERPSENYETDLRSLETRLTEKRISYRVFTSTVLLNEAKWSPAP